MSIVSRRGRGLAAVLVGVSALASVGCGEGPDPREDTQAPVQQVSAPLDNLSAPTVALTAPAPGSFLRGTVTLTADASDDVGVSRVDFFDGATLIGSATQAPFSVSWNTTTVVSGTHPLTAQAFDVEDNSATSSAVSVLVDNFVPIILTGSPQYNPQSQNYVRGIVGLSWAVTDQSLSGVALVELLRNGSFVASQPGHSGVTYNFTWDTRVMGNTSYSLTLRATDNAGNVQTNTRTLVVDNALPSSVLTAPAHGAVVSGLVTLSANASDSQALIYVAFEIDGVLQSPFSATAPFTRTWDTTGKSGTHVIVAVAYDRAGNSRRSNAATVTVP
ncbi:Ig-like domain-containing protein [Myxococcus qinghaiensis]|uniref:Ig-like domain-containing protein n=1 Tax=Myxococcus qinghaiensis TaxID=2906758 RepID=UPI0020A76174|nr:Ig-like domain-containing protein [Myxococcus qinghaiensis]MCP3166420.1 Ig-like domain-containing protein [Myxococcus qinghaiensis]